MRQQARRDGLAAAAGMAAAVVFAVALAGFGAALEGFDHALHPVALPGAAGVPRAGAYNVLAFLVPGALAALVALRRRGALGPGAPLAARLGWTLALLAALAFAAQGLLPLDPADPAAGRGRLHGTAWGLWGIAFAAAATALALASARAGRALAAAGHALAGAATFALAWLSGDLLPVALAQRVAFACWFAWTAWAGMERAWRPRRPLR